MAQNEREVFERREDERRFGDDPNPKLDRMKLHGFVRSDSGKWAQQVGDEFYSLDEKRDKKLIEQLNKEMETRKNENHKG